MDQVPTRIDAVVVSTQHDEDKKQEELHSQIKEFVIDFVLKEVQEESKYNFRIDDYTIYVNPTGRFVIGGPQGDAGLTGRKIIVDTYGGAARHGGGCFSGKDPSKVDRSAAYALRWIAKNVVAAGLANRIEIQAAYAIGVPHPVGMYVETFGTGKVTDAQIVAAIESNFDLRPAAIVRDLRLLSGEFKYQDTAAYGHFGRSDKNFPWEETDRAPLLKGNDILNFQT